MELTFIGKYFIFLKFEDGTEGYLMRKDNDQIMVCNTTQNAARFLSRNKAANYFYNKEIESGVNINSSKLTGAWVYSDGKFLSI